MGYSRLRAKAITDFTYFPLVVANLIVDYALLNQKEILEILFIESRNMQLIIDLNISHPRSIILQLECSERRVLNVSVERRQVLIRNHKISIRTCRHSKQSECHYVVAGIDGLWNDIVTHKMSEHYFFKRHHLEEKILFKINQYE
jgi:hypothetical protein